MQDIGMSPDYRAQPEEEYYTDTAYGMCPVCFWPVDEQPANGRCEYCSVELTVVSDEDGCPVVTAKIYYERRNVDDRF